MRDLRITPNDRFFQAHLDHAWVRAACTIDLRELRGLKDHSRIIPCYAAVADKLIVQLSSFVLGGCPETVSIHHRWPLDWWQAFRARWFPVWWLRRHPVAYECYDYERTFYAKVCPHVAVDLKGTHFAWIYGKGEEPFHLPKMRIDESNDARSAADVS